MRAHNMTHNGRSIPNQYIINAPDATYFQSYDSIIVKTCFEYDVKVTYLDSYYWDYSRTTSKYRNLFLGCTTKECKDRIKSGQYKLVDLNSKEI